MVMDRRKFLQHSCLLAGATIVGGARVFADTPSTDSGSDLITRMIWLNPPASWHRSGDRLEVRSGAKVDFWREPPGDIRDTGNFFHLPVAGEFIFQARFQRKYAGQYDHAGLMVRVDAENWVKCGTEFFDGQRHASVVFTRHFSDWSTMADFSNDGPVWWRVLRKKNWIETSASMDGKNFTSIRQGYFTAAEKTDVGVMCASPKGAGFDVSFDQLSLETH